MNKLEFVKQIAAKSGETQKTVESVLNGITEILKDEIRTKGEKISIPGLGTFKQKINKERDGISPLNGEPFHVPETFTIAFTPAPSMKELASTCRKQAKGKK